MLTKTDQSKAGEWCSGRWGEKLVDLSGNKRETPRPNRGPGVVAAEVDPCRPGWVKSWAMSNRWLVGWPKCVCTRRTHPHLSRSQQTCSSGPRLPCCCCCRVRKEHSSSNAVGIAPAVQTRWSPPSLQRSRAARHRGCLSACRQKLRRLSSVPIGLFTSPHAWLFSFLSPLACRLN